MTNLDYEENDYEVCIWGGCNVPTLSDVEMLCDDVHIERGMIRSGDCGIDVYFSKEWWENWSQKEYEGGNEFWKKACC